jgi:hypothetical protein
MRKVLLLVWLVWASGCTSLGGLEQPPVEGDRAHKLAWFQTQGWEQRWPLHLAAFLGDETKIRQLCRDAKCDANQRMTDMYGTTPLGWAAAGGSLSATQLLVELGADPLVAPNEAGYTPLAEALREDNFLIAKYLKEYEIAALGALRAVHQGSEPYNQDLGTWNTADCRKVAADVVTFVGLADSEWAIIETQEQALAQSEITHFERAGYWSQQAANYAQIFSVFCR